jgi:hypothetical protein
MATGDAAPAVAAVPPPPPPPPLTIPPPPVEPLSEDGSSPLSDVEDKEDEQGGLHDVLGSSRQPGPDGGDHHEDHDDENDDDSDGELSEANDTEAETERLYDTPQSASRQKNVVLDRDAGGHRLERTPTKLRQGMTVNTAAGQDDDEEDDDDDDALSEPSIASSPPPPAAHVATVADKPPSPSLACLAKAAAADDHQAETRKRKRPSLPVGKPDVNPSPRKRTEAAAAVGDHDGDIAMADEEDGPTNTQRYIG